MSDFRVRRLGIVMEPRPGDALEAKGVLNPAVIRGRDGQLYLFPRLVAKGNYSRIGIARVRFNDAGDPESVERLGVVLEPEADYEIRADGGGCEDPRITFVEELQRYVMTYTAFSPRGPRIALAESEDLFNWRRLGLASFLPHDGLEFEDVDNKDASIFPVSIPDVAGRPALAMLHRPLFPGTRPEQMRMEPLARPQDIGRESIWISYCTDIELCCFSSHHRLATPLAAWERLKIGAGAPPVLTPQGWLVTYHGVGECEAQSAGKRMLRYSVGLMVLARERPHEVVYRSPHPILAPELPEERVGAVADVVFPTGVDQRNDLGAPERFDIYYGMADNRIGAASLHVPESLPASVAAA